MKKFIISTIIFLLLFGAIIIPLELHKFNSSQQTELNGGEVYLSIEKSKTHKKVKILIIGASVANQLYPNKLYNDSIYSLACNQAITLAGHYFLLNNFLKANTDSLPDKVILLFTPFALGNNLDQYTFHYFLKPFYNSEYIPLMDNELKKEIKHIPLYFTSQMPFVKTSNYTPDYTGSGSSGKLFSPISARYLERMLQICKDYNIKVEMYPTPIKESRRNELMFRSERNDFQSKIAPEIIKDYEQKYVFYPDSLYMDEMHFKKGKVPSDYLKIVVSG